MKKYHKLVIVEHPNFGLKRLKKLCLDRLSHKTYVADLEG